MIKKINRTPQHRFTSGFVKIKDTAQKEKETKAIVGNLEPLQAQLSSIMSQDVLHSSVPNHQDMCKVSHFQAG